MATAWSRCRMRAIAAIVEIRVAMTSTVRTAAALVAMA